MHICRTYLLTINRKIFMPIIFCFFTRESNFDWLFPRSFFFLSKLYLISLGQYLSIEQHLLYLHVCNVSVYPSICLEHYYISIYPSIYLSIHLYNYPSLYLSINPWSIFTEAYAHAQHASLNKLFRCREAPL